MENNKQNKQDFLNKLGKVNNVLDVIRTNLNIIIYNLISNEVIKELPNIDYEYLVKLINEVDKKISGINQDYFKKNEEAKKEKLKENGQK